MSWCIEEEPKVIDNAMIRKCIDDLARPGEAGRLQKEEGTPFEEVDRIRLEYKKIIRIDHMWVLTSLTKLSLNNNLIETIENLDTLVNLRELDFSFNKITKIQNLENLEQLEVLCLFENRIEQIENLDNQKQLMIFSIGNNLIKERNNILYLRKFKNLKSLNMAGNPCAEEENFRIFIAIFLPQLVYYEYRRIQDFEREFGRETFQIFLRDVEETEEQERKIIEKKEKEIADAKIHSLSFVEYLGSSYLFDSMFEDDEEGNLFLKLGDEVQEQYDQFKEQFVEACKNIFVLGQEQYEIRQNEIKLFRDTVETAKQESQQQSIKLMEDFLEKKNVLFQSAKELQSSFESQVVSEDDYISHIHNISDEFSELIHGIWKQLMDIEVTLNSQLDEVNQIFEVNLTDMMSTFIEGSQAMFTEMRSLEGTYNEFLTDLTTRILTTRHEEEIEIPPELEPFFIDKDTLSNALGATHDVHSTIIDKREDVLLARARGWLDDLITHLYNDETRRDRMKVLEINHFLDIQREEFDDLISVLENLLADPDNP